MTWASRATRRQPFPTIRFSSAPTGTSTASRRTKIRRVVPVVVRDLCRHARHPEKICGLLVPFFKKHTCRVIYTRTCRTHHKEKRISYERIRGLKIKKHQFQARADNS